MNSERTTLKEKKVILTLTARCKECWFALQMMTFMVGKMYIEKSVFILRHSLTTHFRKSTDLYLNG